jgi:Kef-type K+ transport system membrane component KefB/nucleotide-binding universal stress UspA family protein
MSGSFTAAPHGDILHLLVMITVLLVVARGLGELSSRLGQPSVIGEIMAGVLLGPSVLGSISPTLVSWTVPQNATQGHLLEVVGLIGVMFLLVVIGFETDLALIRQKARIAFAAAVGGLVLPLAGGLLLGYLFPADLIPGSGNRLVFALFLAAALSITAIPVLAKVLRDLGLMRRDAGQTMIASAMIDDITGWTLLGIVTSLAALGRVVPAAIVQSVLTVVGFVLITAFLGRFIVTRSLAFVQDRMTSENRLLTLVVTLAFAWGAFTQALGLEPVLGAFAVGILFGRMRRLPPEVPQKLEGLSLGIFGPIFFAIAGLKVDITSLAQPRLLWLTVLVVGVATASKTVGAYLGARYLAQQGHWTALAFGSGLNARGAVGIIVASIGLSLGILGQPVYSMVVVMAIVTSLMAPFALRYVMRRVEPEADEAARLRREETAAGSLVSSIRRVLLPVRPRGGVHGGAQTIEAVLLGHLARHHGLAVTLLSVANRDQRAQSVDFLNQLEPLFGGDTSVTKRVVEDPDPAAAVLNEAQRDYDLVVLGAREVDSTSEALFGGVVDEIVRLVGIPSLVVRGAAVDSDWRPRRIVIPTDGTPYSRRAAELAYAVAEPDALVTVVHVVQSDSSTHATGTDRAATKLEIGRQLTDDLRQVGESLGIATETEVRLGPAPEDAILATARRVDADLVVLGTGVRAASSRLFLGPRVERILNACPCPVVVVNT